MDTKQTFVIQTLAVTFILNAILLAAVYFVGGVFVTFGVGFLITMVLWFAVQTLGKRAIEGSASSTSKALPQERTALAAPPKAPPAAPSEASALQVLSILQRKGRFIDFLQEDLSQYGDAQIGAAVRNIHDGCKQALGEYITLEPIFEEEEGSAVTVASGFNAHEIRLTGNIVGDPPFKGALRHRGWRVAQVNLPKQTPDARQERIIAAAEVEVNG